MNIYVTRRIPETGLKMIEEKFGKFEMNPDDRVLTREELLEKVKGRDAVLCLLTDTIDDAVMEAAGPQCKIFSNYAVGFNNIDVTAASKRKVMITNTPGVLTDTTADMAIALMFGVARRMAESDVYMRSGKFQGWGPMLLLGKEMTGKTLGIIGAGRIGDNVATKMAKGFGMKILYTDLNGNEHMEKELGAKKVDMQTLCKESDYISIHVNYCKETHHLINEEVLSWMHKGTILINTARGPVIDEEALVKALKSNQIFGAGLDVFELEPKMKEGLAECLNTVIAPHLGSATIDTRDKMGIIAAQNLIDALSGKMPEFLVNKEAF
ncbi:D-glycerate dehydrogenase [Candidatus Peregrinibacteria bacterium RIFOXYB12_FULL_41_12]|nr:MAG: D-glycerate dehydrogenase [Candidatus Peregrinibacteria bacterium RIFOXYB12_FULL_41_12]